MTVVFLMLILGVFCFVLSALTWIFTQTLDPSNTPSTQETQETQQSSFRRTTKLIPQLVLGKSLQFEDTFDTYSGKPDPRKWTYEIGAVRNNEAQFYTDNNAVVKNGMLVIEARREQRNGMNFTSASVITKGRFSFCYGVLEVRAKVPNNGRGAWPACWLLPENGGWPEGGEIDLMEQVSYDPNTVHASIHTANRNGQNKNRDGATANTRINAGEFCTYQLIWTKDMLDFRVNGSSFFKYRNPGTGSSDWPFDRPFYILCNLAVGGSWGGIEGIEDNKFPMQFVVDYVRVYQ